MTQQTTQGGQVPPQQTDEQATQKSLWEQLQRMIGGLFSFGDTFSTLFWLLVVAVVGYYAATSKTIGDWMQKNAPELSAWLDNATNGMLFGGAAAKYAEKMTVEDARGLMKDTPKEILDVLIPDQASWEQFRALVKSANEGKLTQDAFLSDATLRSLILNQPDKTLKIARILSSNPEAGAGATGTKLKASIAKLVADTPALAELLNPKNIENTVAIFEALCPVKFAPGSLRQLIEKVGMVNGTVSDALAQMLKTAVTVGSDPQVPAEQKTAAIFQSFLVLVGSGHAQSPENLAVSVQFIQGIASNDPAIQAFKALTSTPNNLQQLTQLQATLDRPAPGTFMDVIALAQTDQIKLLQFLSKNEPIRAALQNWALKTDTAAIPYPQWAQSIELVRKLDKPWVDLLSVLAPTGILTQVDPLMKIDEMVNSVAFNLLINPELRSKLDLGKLGASLKALVDSGYVNTVKGEDGIKLRRAMTFITTVGKDASGASSYVNLSALVGFIQSVQQNLDTRKAAMQKENKPDTEIKATEKAVSSVLAAIYEFALGKPDALLKMPPQLIADFFADSANAAAAGVLLQKLDLSKLPEYKPLFDVLKQYWKAPSISMFGDDNKIGHGFHKVFADKSLVEFLQARARGEAWWSSYQYMKNPTIWHNDKYLEMLGKAIAALPNAPAVAPSLPKDVGFPLNTSGITNATTADPGQNVAPGSIPATAPAPQPARAAGQ